MKDKLIIAFTGEARVGKSTASSHLQKAWDFQEYPLAFPIKKATSHLFGWSMDRIENHKEEVDPEYGISPREVLQALGTDFSQHLLSSKYPDYAKVTGRNLFVKRFHSFLRVANHNRVVIPDLRFPHERNYLTLSFPRAIIVKIERDRDLRIPKPVTNNHESEMHIDEIEADFFVTNNGSFKHLFYQLDEILDQVLRS